MTPRSIITAIIGLIVSIIQVVLIGRAYFGGDIPAAQGAFWLGVVSAGLFLVIALCLGKPETNSESYRGDKVGEVLSKAGWVLLTLGAFAGQRWALGWAFWIDIASLIFVGLLLLIVVVALASKGVSASNSKDWRARV